MAACNERDYRKLFTDFLLNTDVNNCYTLDELKRLFPRKYQKNILCEGLHINIREHKDVRTLYDAYQTKQRQMRDRVMRNIELHCGHKEAAKPEGSKVANGKYEDDIADLEAREEMLQEEIDTMQRGIDCVKEKLGSFVDTLEKRNLLYNLQRTDFDTKELTDANTRSSRRKSER
ncbi:uncharacterized protein [Montipora foliosa]|uniref:uncharacterized protein isoform X1 n=1 Tax=Montipora foliosa TaxID=591990 RepID=UPI0035F1EFFE